MAYSVRHITNFRYAPAVRESVMEVRMQPRTDFRQRCMTFPSVFARKPTSWSTAISSETPSTISIFRTAPISSKSMAQAIVDVLPSPEISQVGSWNTLDELVSKADYWEMMVPSHFATPTDLLEKLAAELRVERRGTPYTLLVELNSALYETFDYVPNTTEVDSPIDDSLQSRHGVCQDFAHIMITLVRRLRIPAATSAAIYITKIPIEDRSPAGATHAWVEAYLGELGWLGFDPTNNLLGCERHVRVALGRDYSDVPPTRGVFKGEAENELSVLVTVSSVDAPEPEELPPATVIRTKHSARPNTPNTTSNNNSSNKNCEAKWLCRCRTSVRHLFCI